MKNEQSALGGSKVAYTMTEAKAATGLGATKLYEEIGAGRLKAVKVGRRTLIPATSLNAWLAALPARSAA